MRQGARGRLFAAGALTVPYAPFVLGWTAGDGVPGIALLALAGLLAPALPGFVAGGASLPGRVVGGIASAAMLHAATIVLLRLTGVEPVPAAFAAVLGVLTAAAGALAAPRLALLPRAAPVPLAVGAGAALLFAAGAAHVVPPLEDQDFEVQATANGLVRDLSPAALTNRSRLHFFAHPPLLHLLAASTITLAGDLDAVRPAYDTARGELEAGRGAGGRGPSAVVRAFRDSPPVPDRTLLWTRDVYGAFLRDPALPGTRAPNVLLGAVAAALVLGACRRLGAGRLDAALAAAAYVTLPEIFVRSSYGGYYALTAVTLLAGAWIAAEPRGGRPVIAGAAAALANHKSVILGAAAAALFGAARALRLDDARRGAAALVLGLAAGAAAFWIWGLAIAPADFVGEHLLDHGVKRFAGGEALGRNGAPVYPSRAGVWLEFGRHFGPAWCAAAAAGLLWSLAFPLRAAAAERRALVLVLAAWVLVGAIAFTLTDWRQTKHLCLLVPALAVLSGGALARVPRAWKWPARAVLLGSIAWGAGRIGQLAADFYVIRPTPLW